MIRLTRRLLLGGIIGSAVLGPLTANPRAANGRKLLLSYFEGGRDATPGLRFAVSEDGLTFRPLHGGRVLLTPEVGEEKLMRDPFLVHGPRDSDPWHLLWTTAWNGVTLGHTTSDD